MNGGLLLAHYKLHAHNKGQIRDRDEAKESERESFRRADRPFPFRPPSANSLALTYSGALFERNSSEKNDDSERKRERGRP